MFSWLLFGNTVQHLKFSVYCNHKLKMYIRNKSLKKYNENQCDFKVVSSSKINATPSLPVNKFSLFVIFLKNKNKYKNKLFFVEDDSETFSEH